MDDPHSMARPTPSRNSRTTTSHDLEAWIDDDPPLEENCRRLLIAYREALSRANSQGNTEQVVATPSCEDATRDESSEPASQSVTPRQEDSSSDGESSSKNPNITSPPRVRSVPRLAEVEDLNPEFLAGMHGQLIAMGYLAEELMARSGGIAYRLTRDGIRRLNQSLEDPEAEDRESGPDHLSRAA